MITFSPAAKARAKLKILEIITAMELEQYESAAASPYESGQNSHYGSASSSVEQPTHVYEDCAVLFSSFDNHI